MLARIGTGLSLLFLIAVLAVSVGGLKAHAADDVTAAIDQHCDEWRYRIVFHTVSSLQAGKTPAELKREARAALGAGRSYEAVARLIDIVDVEDEEAAKTILAELHSACVADVTAQLKEARRKARI